MYKFIKTKDPNNEYDTHDVIVTVDNNELTLPQLLEVFKGFLQACTFCFKIGDQLDVVNDTDIDDEIDDEFNPGGTD